MRDYLLGEKEERERNASLIDMVAADPDDFRRLMRDLGTAGALRSLATMIRDGSRSNVLPRVSPATIERETIAAWLERKAQAAGAHAREHVKCGDGAAAERVSRAALLCASLAAEVRAGVYVDDSAQSRVMMHNPFAPIARGGKTAASIAAVEDARAAGSSVAVVSPAGVEVLPPTMPDECRAFLSAMADNTPGDNTDRVNSTAHTALERLITDVYGK